MFKSALVLLATALTGLCASHALAADAAMPTATSAATSATPSPANSAATQAANARNQQEAGDATPYPTRKRYDDFTPAEKAALRSLYDGMPETDEPPFPADGLRRIMDEVVDLGVQAKAVGLVSIFVKVDAAGNATGVRVMKTPDIDVAKAIAFVLIKAKYKPAVCGGKPCEMEFPFRVMLRVS